MFEPEKGMKTLKHVYICLKREIGRERMRKREIGREREREKEGHDKKKAGP